MNRIHVLDESVASRIAAGEVVVNPAAVVKELMENALDAGATAVTVEIVDGGKELVRVTDNGSGIHEEDMELAVTKHATSKITVVGDLSGVATLGFRGEALSSMAAVSRLTVSSRPMDSISGCVLQINGGGQPELSVAGLPEGTTVKVESLFYNVPARRKFLKNTAQEAAKIGSIITKMIVSKPFISFKYVNNGKLIYHSLGNGILIDALATVYGKDIKHKLIEVDFLQGDIRITGYISKPSFLYKSASHIDFFLNGRYIQSPALKDALLQGYGERILRSHFPFCVLELTMPYDYADVNVHPGKLQVLFYHENDVKEAMKAAVVAALEQATTPPVLDISTPVAGAAQVAQQASVEALPKLNTAERLYQKPVHSAGESAGRLMDRQPEFTDTFEETFDKIIERDTTNEQLASQQPELEDVRNLLDFTVVGQVFQTYIICEYGQTLYLIDQHAAHERLNYERMKSAHQQGRGTAQQLLLPVVRKFSQEEFATLQQNAPLLDELGFEFEEFGPLSYKFTALPVEVDKSGVHALVDEIIHELKDSSTDILLNRDKVIRASCRYSIKAGYQLSREEIGTLMADITSMDAIPTCPHGRPIAITLSKAELQKGFKRTV